MRALVLSVTAGQGHNSCAKSIIASLEYRGVKCRMLDTVKYINYFAGETVDKGYLTLGKYVPKAWGGLYNQALKSSVSGGVMAKIIKTPMLLGRLKSLIFEFDPDVVISTHVFPALMMTHLRQEGLAPMPLIGINTDFTLHPFWEEVKQDRLVLACDKMHYMVHKRGIPDNQVMPIGIPVHRKFAEEQTAARALEKLGLPNKTTVSIMSGSMGFGNVMESVQELDAMPVDYQMIVICGNNLKLYNALIEAVDAGEYQKDIYVYKFVGNVEDIMAASNIICTKPGGLSLSEALTVRRPIVMLEPIPGLEEYNAAFMVNCGAAVQTGKYYTLSEAVYNLLQSPERIQSMLSIQDEMIPKLASEKLASYLVENWGRDASDLGN